MKSESCFDRSTYLLAWANGEFEYLSSSVKSPISGKTIPLRIYATKEHIHQAQYALDVTATVLPIYEQLFQVAYPLSKLDTLVAADFDAGKGHTNVDVLYMNIFRQVQWRIGD